MLACLFALLCAALPQQSPPPSFRAVVLEGFGFDYTAVAINDSGIAVGIAGNSAARWEVDGSLVLLDHVGGISKSAALGVSAEGMTVGCMEALRTLPTAWLPSGAGYAVPVRPPAIATAVSPFGDVLVQSVLGDSTWAILLPRVGSSQLIDFGDSGFAYALSGDLRVAGTRSTSTAVARAFRWTAGVFEDLKPIAGAISSDGRGIAPNGTVVGASLGGQVSVATYWGLDNVPHALPGARPGSSESIAFGANSSGWIVGFEINQKCAEPNGLEAWGTLWVGGAGYKLTDLITEGPSVVVWAANALNERGQIAGYGYLGGVMRAVRLDPL